MAINTVVQQASTPSYGAFISQLTWDINELHFRVQAALSLLHESEDIDADKSEGLALSYLLQGMLKRSEELALRASGSELDYEAKYLEEARHGH